MWRSSDMAPWSRYMDGIFSVICKLVLSHPVAQLTMFQGACLLAS